MVIYTFEQRWEVGLQSTYRRCRFWKKKNIIFSDEAHFDLGGYVNKQNFRIWGTEKPHAYIEKPTHPKRVTVWCGFWSGGTIGAFFFENFQWRSLSGHVERIFVHKKLKRRILTAFDFKRTALRAFFWKCFKKNYWIFFQISFFIWKYNPSGK